MMSILPVVLPLILGAIVMFIVFSSSGGSKSKINDRRSTGVLESKSERSAAPLLSHQSPAATLDDSMTATPPQRLGGGLTPANADLPPTAHAP